MLADLIVRDGLMSIVNITTKAVDQSCVGHTFRNNSRYLRGRAPFAHPSSTRAFGTRLASREPFLRNVFRRHTGELIKRGYQNVRLLAASHLNEKAIGCNIGKSSALLCRDVSTGCRRISCAGIYSR